MRIDGRHWRTIWPNADGSVGVIDQTRLPHRFETVTLSSLDDAARAIRDMVVRGAPLIGATAAYGIALALAEDATHEALERAIAILAATRPTAVNLRWALERMRARLVAEPSSEMLAVARSEAAAICDEDVATNAAIGRHGLRLIERLHAENPGRPVEILTHCNAGWLACVDWGTATAPIYMAHDAGIPVHVLVDETRPRNQGAALTAFELGRHGVPHHVVVDNAGGHYMRSGAVDMVIVGTDRTAANGDVANKIGTYLKALAAADAGVPFYVALPSSTIDWRLACGDAIPIEERAAREVTHIQGLGTDGRLVEVRLTPEGSPALNPAFDVTPARLVTGLVTERGVAPASSEGLLALFPERR